MQTEAQVARDEALERVGSNAGENFAEQVQEVVRTIPHYFPITGEDIRVRCESIGIKPHHHNAWGAVIRGLVTRGKLLPTGEHIAMTTKKSHARMTPVYLTPRLLTHL